ncbi:MAG: hypothetical protein AAB691_04775, partial [Patescibacteria group bacterium]
MNFLKLWAAWSKEDVGFVAIVALILLPTVFMGGMEPMAQAMIFTLVTLLVLFFREEVFLGGRLYKTVFFSCILFLVSIFISGFFSFDRYTTARLFLIFFSAFIVFIKTPSIIKEFAKIERFFSWLLWGTILFSLYGLYIFFGAHPFFRLGSVFYQQNAFAGFMLPSLFFATSFLFYESKQSRKWWYAAINIFLFCTLFFTFARGAALAFLGSFLITMFLLRWPFSKIWRRSATLF